MNRNYGNVNALVQSTTPNSKLDGGCNHCGAQGHWKKDCPQLKKRMNFPKGRSGSRFKLNRNSSKGSGKNRTANARGRSDSKQDLGLKVPPKQGESEIKFFPDNTKRYWCSKCGRWTLSHSTSNHRDRKSVV